MIRTIIEIWILTGLLSLIFLYENSENTSFIWGKNRSLLLIILSIIFPPIIFLCAIDAYFYAKHKPKQ